MNLHPLFSIALFFFITSIEAHRGRSRKDGRHDHFLSIEPSSSSSSSSSHDSSSDEVESTRGSGKRGHHKPRPPIAQEPVEEKCPTDWLTFDRPQGKWCVKVSEKNYHLRRVLNESCQWSKRTAPNLV
ncbi:hypothetical protein GCK72_003531 [Caenorhabditis remanei]|uniref:Uncharacterized protein n=1 Tax=Caenorhabditis remanei TaxID=31234 RepID=A0A6A5HXI7_CAERE|nr:hypothetical protein GCK72_003531 [Caenorhabditis remanei]KAF1771704.1 hypothetical protein GCK72_003531 [Caenorhabditis remanei]